MISWETINTYQEQLIQWRNYFHQYPEISGREFKTSHYLKQQVSAMNLPIVEVKNSTGFIAILDTKKPGKTIALRSDIDALPIVEDENHLAGARPIISKNKGAAHMCGHDGHMATLLTAIDILRKEVANFSGKILFIFEEGEETGSGIAPMLETLTQFKIDAFYGNHVMPHIPVGSFGIANMAGCVTVDFSIIGQSGHGSRPDLSINPIMCASDILSTINTLWNNKLNVTETVTLGITRFTSGTTHNVFPEEAHLQGTLRYYNQEEGYKAKKLLQETILTISKLHRCQAIFHGSFATDKVIMPLIQDDTLKQLAKELIAQQKLGHLIENEPDNFASESFGAYRQIAPIIFPFIGIHTPALGTGASLHSCHFELDPQGLLYGVALMTNFAISYLNRL